MSIRRLPPELINRIAAGEVVERPASALKELVENSLDAGATSVSVRLHAGGLELIEVADDGSGMNPDEMALALERHATSKLPSDAIDQVTSFGFRGEALPSIASVARVTIESRVRGEDGWRIAVNHGERAGEGPAALPPGTRIRVEGLFDKVPARRKFLRSSRAEDAACGLSRPHRPRPPPDRSLVPRRSARGSRRQRPPGQDRGALSRSRRRSRPDRRRTPAGAR